MTGIDASTDLADPAGDAGAAAFDRALADRLFDERTAALAGRGAAAPVAGADHALFAVGRSVWALPVTALSGVTTPGPVGPLPGAPAAVLGIARIGGRFTLIVDAAVLIGLSAGAEAGGHVLLLRHEPPVALAVDRVLQIRFLPAASAPVTSTLGRAVVAVHRLAATGLAGVDTVAVLDADRLLDPVLPASAAAGA